ncbi:hypothetical protein ACEPAF_1475 [Sanghuangporus sanghuang]
MHKGDTHHRSVRCGQFQYGSSSSEDLDSEETSTVVDVLDDGDVEKAKTSPTLTSSSKNSNLLSDILNWFSPTMTRTRTTSTSISKLPLYDSRPPRLRNGSPPKVRRKRSLFLAQMKRNTFSHWWLRLSGGGRPRSLYQLFRILFLVFLFILVFIWVLWEPHIEITFYRRSWIAREVLAVEPLSGCFDPSRVSPRYNLSQIHAPKRVEVHSGMPMRFGLDCYDFASTIQPLPRDLRHSLPYPDEKVNFHTYWRADLVPFGERQEWMVKSFFATQDLSHSRLILWSNGDLRSNEMVRRWTRKYPDNFQLRIVDVESLAKGTALEGSDLLYAMDSKAWVDGDLVRLLVTWAYGGVWVDMDSLLTRDLSPLLEHEFVTQWDCYDKIYQPMNGAVMHFFQHSPYLCEAFEVMSRSPPPKQGTTEWGSLLYFKLFRRLLAASIPPFKILPYCFTDGRSCRLDNRLPDPFARDTEYWAGMRGMHEGGPLDQVLGKVFSVHLHNQWHKSFPRGGWVERLLLKRYDRALGIIDASPLRLHKGAEKRFVVSKDDD